MHAATSSDRLIWIYFNWSFWRLDCLPIMTAVVLRRRHCTARRAREPVYQSGVSLFWNQMSKSNGNYTKVLVTGIILATQPTTLVFTSGSLGCPIWYEWRAHSDRMRSSFRQKPLRIQRWSRRDYGRKIVPKSAVIYRCAPILGGINFLVSTTRIRLLVTERIRRCLCNPSAQEALHCLFPWLFIFGASPLGAAVQVSQNHTESRAKIMYTQKKKNRYIICISTSIHIDTLFEVWSN